MRQFWTGSRGFGFRLHFARMAAAAPDWMPSTPEERLFEARFRALTGHRPFRWQWRLFENFTKCEWPYQIDLPTGLGKTSVIALWLLALGRALEKGAEPLLQPRRLAYVVDRRVVVDQASEEAEAIVTRLEQAVDAESDELHSLAVRLRDAGCDGEVVALSALRGQRTLDTSWRTDPSRPSIIIGTVDMIGSRLLFSAYGRVGRWGRPYEAGLLAQDCLVVLDEAHLSQPFDDTLASLEVLVARRPCIRPFAVVRMGATSRPCPVGRRRFVLEEEDREPRILQRLQAGLDGRGGKRLELRTVSEAGAASDLATWAVETASRTKEENPVIGLVLNTVRAARDAHAELRKRLREASFDQDAVLVLTGSMRGIERDEIVRREGTTPEARLYQRLRADRDRSLAGPSFLVATSCIEVGADIDLDYLGTEACALDSLVQRLGRVNRRGEREAPSQVRVLVPNAPGKETAGSVTHWLRHLRYHAHLVLDGEVFDASPVGVPRTAAEELEAADHEFRMSMCGAPEPVPVLNRATVDDLAMTSLSWEDADRPDVALWLHGCAPDDEGGYVELGWRTELEWVRDEEDAAGLLDAYPLAPRETARCTLGDAVRLLERLRASEEHADHVLVVIRGGTARGQRIGSLPDNEAELYRLVAWAQVALPCSAGGYEHHFVDPRAEGVVTDVAERALPETWAPRRRLWLREGSIGVDPEQDGSVEAADAWAAENAEELRTACDPAARILLGNEWEVVAAGGSAERGVLVARQRKGRVLESAEDDRASVGYVRPVTLEQHLQDAAGWAEKLCDRLRLDASLRESIVGAARAHDLGKNRPWWQRAIGVAEPPPLAKSGRRGFDHAVNAGYRHELGSLLDVLRQNDTPTDLVAHLVATHHGYGRPSFAVTAAGPASVRNREEVEEVISRAARRFAKLHQQFGAWQLAYLEAIVKAADALASREVDS
jgi:CRISPR-associated endonuclease/helicase Cas3